MLLNEQFISQKIFDYASYLKKILPSKVNFIDFSALSNHDQLIEIDY